MAFDPTRLTGKRRRKWARSMNWAPAAGDIPKTLLKFIRYPGRLKLWARVKTDDGEFHYVAVVRSRVVLFHHGTAAEDAVLDELANRPARCRCHKLREMVATLHLCGRNDAHESRLYESLPTTQNPKRRRVLASATCRNDLPKGWADALDGRRKPVGTWRRLDPSDRARHRYADKFEIDPVPPAWHYPPATPPTTLIDRWTQTVAPVAVREVELRLAQALALHPDDELVVEHSTKRDNSGYDNADSTATAFQLSTSYDTKLGRHQTHVELKLDALSWVAGVYGYDMALAVPGHFVTAAWGGSRTDPDAPFLVEAVQTGRLRDRLTALGLADRETDVVRTTDDEVVVYGLFHRPSRSFRLLSREPVRMPYWPVDSEHARLVAPLPGYSE